VYISECVTSRWVAGWVCNHRLLVVLDAWLLPTCCEGWCRTSLKRRVAWHSVDTPTHTHTRLPIHTLARLNANSGHTETLVCMRVHVLLTLSLSGSRKCTQWFILLQLWQLHFSCFQEKECFTFGGIVSYNVVALISFSCFSILSCMPMVNHLHSL